MPPVRAVLLDFYCTLVDLSDPVRSRGFDAFARQLGLPLRPGELYHRYTEMISAEPQDDDDAPGCLRGHGRGLRRYETGDGGVCQPPGACRH